MRALGLLFAFLLVAVAPTAGVLIVQTTTASHADDADPNRTLLQLVAEAIDNDGRISPIAWSLSDPLFRTAVDQKLIRGESSPSLDSALAAAEKLRAEYVLLVSVYRRGTDVFGRAQLYRKGKLVWKDPEPTSEANKDKSAQDADSRVVTVATNNQLDIPNSLRAASTTWTQLLFQGPLKGLTPRPRVETPAPDPGTKPDIPDAPPPRKVDNKELLNEVMKFLAAKQVAEAISLLRDAVDAEPLDMERRKALANALNTAGMSALAASESRRAAELFPDQPELRTQAARFWLSIGKVDEANQDLNEAVARNPEGVETRLLLGEVALSKLQVDAAIQHLDFVISKAPSADAHFKRALARAMNDDAAGCSADLTQARKLGLGSDPLSIRSQYVTAVSVSQAGMREMGVGLRTLLQKARVNFAAKDVRDDQKVLGKRAESMLALYGMLPVPEFHKNSHGQRTLALKLLSQSLSELGAYLDSGTEDTLGDATITLGEALKALSASDEAYRAETPKG